VKKLADEHGPEHLVVVLGLNEPLNLRVTATTFKEGDPSFAGPLAGVALGIPSYHIFELKDQVPDDVWDEQMAMKELEIEDEVKESVLDTMREVRSG
jgi:betaine reductase